MTAAFWTGWPGIDFRWRPGGGGIAFACGNVGRRKRARNAARGVVADEMWRNREALLPLVDWGPAVAVPDIIRNFGLCPFQRLDELRKLRTRHPELWKRLMELDERARAQFGASPLGQFKPRWSVAGLDERFAREELCAGEGLNAA